MHNLIKNLKIPQRVSLQWNFILTPNICKESRNVEGTY